MEVKAIKQLNKDIKKLNKDIQKSLGDQYYSFIESYAKKEFNRLYVQDSKFEHMNKESVLIMFRLNLTHRFHALHSFGLFIELNDFI